MAHSTSSDSSGALPSRRDALPYPDLGDGPVVQQVDRIVSRAITLGASDVHIEPTEEGLRVRYRIDGVLHLAGELNGVQREAVVSRVKVLASLDIAEKRRPQDGRIRVKHRDEGGGHNGGGLVQPPPLAPSPAGARRRSVDERDVDLRVSVLPTHFGEKVVLRVLDRTSLRMDLGGLGFEESQLGLFRQAVESPYGMVLVTGPTGSGKTTTLYAALSTLVTDRVNVTTVEDPIEYDVAGVNQTQARPDLGFSFAEALRSFLRQDPDIIMVGEIRDAETAGVAIRAALTGHLVLSTLHTNDAPSTVVRLVDMGVEPYLVAASVRLAVAQRLLRTICPECKEADDRRPGASAPLLEGVPPDTPLFRGAGCASCGGTGYRGRVAVFEVMPVSDRVTRAITQGASGQEVRGIALEEGMRTLRQAAVARLVAGETTIEEVIRVTSS